MYKYNTGLYVRQIDEVNIFLNGILLCPGRKYILDDNDCCSEMDIIFKEPPGINSDLCIQTGRSNYWYKIDEYELIDQSIDCPGFTKRIREWI